MFPVLGSGEYEQQILQLSITGADAKCLRPLVGQNCKGYASFWILRENIGGTVDQINNGRKEFEFKNKVKIDILKRYVWMTKAVFYCHTQSS